MLESLNMNSSFDERSCDGGFKAAGRGGVEGVGATPERLISKPRPPLSPPGRSSEHLC